ncbi:MAG: hypothetical protein KDB03_02115 [Planctomycetales bacterium]|nr:hypothetical protein [Planctomycetales bacterium]
MDSPQQRDELNCPECGASNKAVSSCCWLCQCTLNPPTASHSNLADLPQLIPSDLIEPPPIVSNMMASGSSRWRPDAWLLTATLIVVSVGTLLTSPGLGLLVVLLATPAFVRTAVAARRRSTVGAPLSAGEKFLSFIGSLLVVITVAISAGVAFFLTCWVGFCGSLALSMASPNLKSLENQSFMIGILSGLVVGLLVAGLMFWMMFPSRRKM